MFGKNLKHLMEINNISQKELALYLGTTERSLRYYISGKQDPRLSIVLHIANYFNVSLDTLCKEEL